MEMTAERIAEMREEQRVRRAEREALESGA
jgi:hypothetical protein